MPYPAGLRVHQHLPPGYRPPAVVLVHGALDRAASFARVVRRLDDLAVITYDRRGYGGSAPDGPPATLADHVDDLLGVVDELDRLGGPVAAVGHSFGGDVVVGAAIARPDRFASVGAFEPPMPWLGFINPNRPPAGPLPEDADPAVEAERFFLRLVGQAAWDRLPDQTREARRAEGPALVADLAVVRGPAPFDVTTLAVPAVFGRGGPASQPNHRQTVHWLATHVPGAEEVDIDAAGHGAHLSHPDAFAAFIRAVVARAVVGPAAGARTAAVRTAGAGTAGASAPGGAGTTAPTWAGSGT